MILNIPDEDISLIAFLLEESWKHAAQGNEESKSNDGLFPVASQGAQDRALARMLRFNNACRDARLHQRDPLTPQVITLTESLTVEAIACDNGMVALDLLKPRGKWKPVLNMLPAEANTLAQCLAVAANRVTQKIPA